MKPAPFVHHRPKTIEDAVRILAEVAPLDGRVIAGGQSLAPIMAYRMARPPHLVDINHVEGLERLAVEDDALSIGARVRHNDLREGAVEGRTGALLAFVMRHIAHWPIRTRGSFCGSLAHADPALRQKRAATRVPSSAAVDTDVALISAILQHTGTRNEAADGAGTAPCADKSCSPRLPSRQ